MSTSLIIVIVIGVLLAGVFFWLIASYNSLVAVRNRYQNAFAQIDVQLQRRFDLIPNLIETVKKYMSHERETLEAVVAARSMAQAGLNAAKAQPGNPEVMAQLSTSEGQLNSVLGRLLAVAEGYPDLKASQNMMQLSEELTSTENKVAFARQGFNDSAMIYNTKRETFPTMIAAGIFGFKQASLLEIPVEKRHLVQEAPKVQF
ncbi:MAG: LemA family protein [Peptococcaceae bacterium]|nr:LemA family protein [Peptococcaceae bacterium]